jgi:hypothetical protein
MHCAHRPEFVRFLPIFIYLSLVFLCGCGNRSNTPGKQVATDAKDDPVAAALQRLQRDSDPGACREALQAIDAAITANDPRPTAAEQDLKKLGEFARLNAEELRAIAAKEFSTVDSEYLTECLLLRDAVRSLELDKLKFSDEQKAAIVFAWLCRQVYVIEEGLQPPEWTRQPPPPVVPAPTWSVLQEGSGSALDRANAFVGLLRQVGLDGCLVGPPDLANTRSLTVTANPNDRPILAPVRAAGVRIGKEILLFDPKRGQPITGNNGGPIATLAQMRAKPEAYATWLKSANISADEVKNWEIYLIGPLSSSAPRMAWLQQQLAATNPVILSFDPITVFDRFKAQALATGSLADVKCTYWNPANDMLSPTRVLAAYNQEFRGPDGRSSSPLKIAFRHSRFPSAFIPSPNTGGVLLEGKAFELITATFEREFAPVFLVSGSPRDMLLRGQFSNALASLDDLYRTNASHRDRVARETNLEGALKEWSDRASPIFAAVISAERSGDAGSLAKAAADQDQFLKSPASERMIMLVRRRSAPLLCAEAKYLIALVMHERAERIQARLERAPNADLKNEAVKTWENAIDNWKVFINNFPELAEYYQPRFEHARELQQRAVRGLASAKK